MVIYGIRDKDGWFHSVGLTTQKPNKRYSWHVWASRHVGYTNPKTGATLNDPFHSWMAKQDLSTLKMEILWKGTSLKEMKLQEGYWSRLLADEGHPIKTNPRNIGNIGPHGSTMSPEKKAAASAGRKKSKFFKTIKDLALSTRNGIHAHRAHHAVVDLL